MGSKLKEIAINIGSGITPLRKDMSFWANPKYSWLKTEQLGEFEISETFEKISQEAVNKTGIKIWKKNSITVAMYGEGKTRGSVSILTQPMATNQACCNIEVDEEKADYKYVYYWLKNSYKNLRALSSGVRKNLNSDDIKNFPIEGKDLYIQKSISNVLFTIDKKIQINNKINAELEKVAKTLYDYWFVQFDFPDDNGKPYRTSGGAMVYNETLKREIPSGWEVKKIGYVVSRNQRGITPLYNENKDIPIVNQKCIRNNNIDYKEFYWHDKKKAFDKEAVLQFMDTLVNSMGTGTLGRISPYIIKDFALPHSCVTLLRFKPNITTPCWLYRAIKSMETIITKTGIGSTGQTSLDNIDLDKLLICLPPYALLEVFDLKVIDFYKLMTSNNEQIKHLSQLRDFLLPLLMTGQVQVQSSHKMEVASTAVKDKTYYNQRFELWLSNQGLAARGNVSQETLRELFDAMDEDDK